MGKYFIRRFIAEPYGDGTRVTIEGTAIKGMIVSQCPCTSDTLHYILKTDGGRTIVVEHPEIIVSKIATEVSGDSK